MIKFFLILTVVLCATVGVDSRASGDLRKFCNGVADKEVREGRYITLYQEEANKNSLFLTSDGGMYQIAHTKKPDPILDVQEKRIKLLAEAAAESRVEVNLCVSQSTSPYTVRMIEVDNGENDNEVDLSDWGSLIR